MGFMGKIVFKIVQKGMRRTVHGQGILRHSWDELDDMIAEDVNALEKILGDKAFFGGDEPTEIDATTYAFIANMLVPELDTPFLTHSRKSQPLIDYHNRMTERVYLDYKETMLIK
jgi:glutathione S-transferase